MRMKINVFQTHFRKLSSRNNYYIMRKEGMMFLISKCQKISTIGGIQNNHTQLNKSKTSFSFKYGRQSSTNKVIFFERRNTIDKHYQCDIVRYNIYGQLIQRFMEYEQKRGFNLLSLTVKLKSYLKKRPKMRHSPLSIRRFLSNLVP